VTTNSSRERVVVEHRERLEHRGEVELAVAGGMLGDAHDLQAVEFDQGGDGSTAQPVGARLLGEMPTGSGRLRPIRRRSRGAVSAPRFMTGAGCWLRWR
jgi:hypothetical protein